MNDPWFAWLRELSQFIVLVDETLDLEEPATPADADRLIAQARDLLSPVRRRHRISTPLLTRLMQRDPSAVLAHRDMMQVFGAL